MLTYMMIGQSDTNALFRNKLRKSVRLLTAIHNYAHINKKYALIVSNNLLTFNQYENEEPYMSIDTVRVMIQNLHRI